MTIQVSSTDRRDGKALALFAACDTWQRGKTKDGRSFYAIPGSQAGLFHMADCRECSCPDFQRARNTCKHVRAVRLWMAAFKTGAVAPKPRPAATFEDERVALTPEGAAALLDQATDDAERTQVVIARLISEQDACRRDLLARGYRPVDDPVWIERDQQIQRLRAQLPRPTLRTTV